MIRIIIQADEHPKARVIELPTEDWMAVMDLVKSNNPSIAAIGDAVREVLS